MTIESDSTENQHAIEPSELQVLGLAMIAAQLSGGRDPEKHLPAAYKLYCAADDAFIQINIGIQSAREYRGMDIKALEKEYARSP